MFYHLCTTSVSLAKPILLDQSSSNRSLGTNGSSTQGAVVWCAISDVVASLKAFSKDCIKGLYSLSLSVRCRPVQTTFTLSNALHSFSLRM